MSTEQNKALIKRMFEEVINKNDWSLADQVLTPGFVNHDMPMPEPGPAGFKAVIGMFKTAFPDMRITVEEFFGENDRVITRGYFTGSNTGPFMNIPPTGKQVKVKYIDIWRVENGKLSENWVQVDQLGMMQQLGVIPQPGNA